MDEAAIQALGAKPLAPKLEAIRATRDKTAFATLMGAQQGDFGRSFFGLSVSDDQRDPDHYALYLSLIHI